MSEILSLKKKTVIKEVLRYSYEISIKIHTQIIIRVQKGTIKVPI